MINKKKTAIFSAICLSVIGMMFLTNKQIVTEDGSGWLFLLKGQPEFRCELKDLDEEEFEPDCVTKRDPKYSQPLYSRYTQKDAWCYLGVPNTRCFVIRDHCVSAFRRSYPDKPVMCAYLSPRELQKIKTYMKVE